MKLSILIPVYNEGELFCELLDRVINVQLLNSVEKEIIVINDGSRESTSVIVEECIKRRSGVDIKYFKHLKNGGKGSALHTGIKHSTGDYIVVQDADLEYDPNQYNLLLEPILAGVADVVYGSRYIGSHPNRSAFFMHSFGNRSLTFVFNLFNNLHLSDMETCYKLIKGDVLRTLILKEKRFGFEPEVTAKLARIAGIRFCEVGISYQGRSYKEGKKINW